jgi:beta-lactamase class C
VNPIRRLDEAIDVLAAAVDSGTLAGAVLHVTLQDWSFARAFGVAKDPDAVFLLASLTKPMTAAALMRLVECGKLSLDTAVHEIIPEFTGADRASVTLRDLLTHTSGLPDQLPENLTLRRRFAPLEDFVAATCRTPLLFSPGARVSYQSMGTLLAAEMASRSTSVPFHECLRRDFFAPLRMTRTSLGLRGRPIAATMRCEVPNEPWGWNSAYWRNLGAPWGGALGSAPDVTRFLRAFASSRAGPLRASTVRAMTAPQTKGSSQTFGLGWWLGRWPRACSARTFGHFGATGTLCWFDPTRDLTFVLLTTRPYHEAETTIIRPVSELIAEH